ncbi:hypothetical protein Leryth_003795 [Lithospermum erythrorhizon]|nr:hypothetical protein Leryth_003795 [Lithospermum erythrorhizon]
MVLVTDIMGVVIRADNPKDTNSLWPGNCAKIHFSRHGVKVFLFAALKRPIPVSLWDEMVTVVGPLLEEAATAYSVLLAKRLKLQEYKVNRYFSLRFTSAIQPTTVAYSHSLLGTFLIGARESCTLQQIIATHEILVIITWSTFFPSMNSSIVFIYFSQVSDYWTRASMQISLDDQKLFYIGCSNCFKKGQFPQGVDYTCMLCKKDVTSAMRFDLMANNKLYIHYPLPLLRT